MISNTHTGILPYELSGEKILINRPYPLSVLESEDVNLEYRMYG